MSEQIGNDGLTDAERKAYAERYRQAYCGPLTRAEKDAIRAHYAARREALEEHYQTIVSVFEVDEEES